MAPSVVIVGSGQAGYETAVSLRAKGFDGSVTLVGDEPGVPYHRPPLSKAFLKGDAEPVSVTLRPADYFSKNGIDLRCARTAVEIDRVDKRVRIADGPPLDYDKLVLATGSRNRPLSVAGADLPGVVYLRTLAEATELARHLSSSAAVVIIGGGFIGLEVAAAARARGATVTVIEAGDRPMARAVTRTVSSFFVDEHRRQGVDFRLDSVVTEIVARDGRAAGVRCGDGDSVDADLIVVGIGVIPNTEIAQRAGLPVDNGVVVDERLRTEDPAIWAIGDCAAYPDVASHRRVRLESIQNAVDHARCVADQLVGNDIPYQGVPWFWTEQYANRLQVAGTIADADNTVLRGSIADGRFSVFSFAGEVLRAVESVNLVRDHMLARKFLANGSPTRDQVADPAIDLKSLVNT